MAVLGHHKYSGSLTVQTHYRMKRVRRQQCKKRIVKMSVGRVGNYSRSFINNDDMLIFIEDGNRGLIYPGRSTVFDIDLIARGKPVGNIPVFAVDVDGSVHLDALDHLGTHMEFSSHVGLYLKTDIFVRNDSRYFHSVLVRSLIMDTDI